MRPFGSCLIVLGLALGCAGPAVQFDYDSKVDYASYHTYDWYAPSRGAQALAGGAPNPLMDTRVRRAVEAQLAVRNFRRETTGDPDFLVTYYPVYQRRFSRTHVGFGLGLGMGVARGVGVGVGVSGPAGEARPAGGIGSIVLEIQDYKTHQLVWKATAEDVLDASDTPEGSDEDVAVAVKKMLAKFPPTPKAI
jgi:hypothetical protein